MSSRLPLLRPTRRVRRVLSLAVVALLAVPLIAASQAVAVTVDGEEHDLRTYASTVGDVLDELELDVSAADEVTPAPETTLRDGLEIEVARARTVDVRVDGEIVETVEEPVSSVAGVLEAAELGDVREDGALITPAWTAPVDDGDVVDVVLPSRVRLTVGGETQLLDTHAGTVEHLLLDEDVTVGDDDVVTPAPAAPVADADEVVVERVEFDEVVEEVTLEHDEVREETDDLDEGSTRVDDDGRDGLRRDVYRVELVDGEEVDRELVEREVLTEPRDRVVLVGTRAPEPAPEPTPTAPRAATPTTTPSAPSAPRGDVWDRLAQCESGGNWGHRGGMYHGGLQFHPDTWNRHKPGGYPAYAYDASREQQIVVGKRVQASQGWSAWPHCSRQIGVR